MLQEEEGVYREQDVMCLEALSLAGRYYPLSPEPKLTLGTTAHSDPCFLAVLLQDAIGGLQVLVDLDNDNKRSIRVWPECTKEISYFRIESQQAHGANSSNFTTRTRINQYRLFCFE
ncbi:hypothetical protein BRADI_2g36290v3 [Brachypodium distachyon]|uniref:Isopenicillin N synthase-like Fe(2+) 2OG dioxygenase domain-containing protein n=1 Tax=Brachypodium distachyon TaxID=15368 RepID=I1HLZ0_BRADI|nr:hypothetical protein BRADI_2g36290v3 [Brachypodium distachyon]